MLISLTRWRSPAFQTKTRRTLAVHHHWRRRDQHVRRRRIEAVAADDQHVVGRRDRTSLPAQRRSRAVESQRQLPLVVQVGVVHERAGARRREPHDERLSGSISGATRWPHAAPAVHAVVVAVELDAVPVERRRFSQAIDDGDLDGFPAPQHQRRAGRRGSDPAASRTPSPLSAKPKEGSPPVVPAP